MEDILMWIGIIAVGGIFFVFMVYSFYLLIFSKHTDVTKAESDREFTALHNSSKVKTKFVGRA